MHLTRRTFTRAAALAAAGFVSPLASNASAAQTRFRLRNRLFVMDTWFWRSDIEDADRAALLQKLGVRHILLSHGASSVDDEALRLLDQHNISLESVYFTLFIEDAPSEALLDLMAKLEGRAVIFTLAMRSHDRDFSDPAGDLDAIAQVETYAEAARRHGHTIAFYPHVSFWLETVSDAARLSRRFNQSHVGATFNLYHWLARDAQETTLETTLTEVAPYLKVVTLNGAPTNTPDIPADDAILPLDEGDYDLRPLLRELARRGYPGPIGLQGYGIEGEIPDKLARSVEKYQTFREGID